jgi:hypothetical protein
VARPLRLEFAGALYHVTARGNERRDIFLGDTDDDRAALCDRAALLNVLSATCERSDGAAAGGGGRLNGTASAVAAVGMTLVQFQRVNRR